MQAYNSYGLHSNRLMNVNNIVDRVHTPIKVDFEDNFLYDGKRQLKIRFNPKVSSIKNTVLETKTDTLGSKYPFIFRNGNVNYKAEMIVKIISNKNENIYEVIQEENNIKSYQEVVSKGDIEGIKIIYTDDVVKVENSDLKLEKIYKDYEPIMSNYLFLSDFSEDYLKSDETSVNENEKDIVINLKIENSNKYIKYKELKKKKKTGLPIKMIIKDSDKQVRACIEYINIEIL